MRFDNNGFEWIVIIVDLFFNFMVLGRLLIIVVGLSDFLFSRLGFELVFVFWVYE